MLKLTGSAKDCVAAIAAAELSGVEVAYEARDGPAELETPEGVISGPASALRSIARVVPSVGLLGREGMTAAKVDQWIDFGRSAITGDAKVKEFLQQYTPVLGALVNMGVRFSAFQERVASEAVELEGLVSCLDALEAELTRQTFVCGERVSAGDLSVASAFYDVLTLVFPSSYGSGSAGSSAFRWRAVQRWFRTMVSSEFWKSASKRVGLLRGGLPREGGQIDARPFAPSVAEAADFSIELNRDVQRKIKHRKEEDKKAKSEKEAASSAAPSHPAAAAGGGGASGGTEEQRKENLEDTTPEAEEKRAMEFLKTLGLEPTVHRHEPADDMEALEKAAGSLSCTLCKNLFVKAKKPKDETDSMLHLVVAKHDSKVDLKALGKELGYPSKVQVRFANADVLRTNLGALPGHVSPLSLINDTKRCVNVVLDSRMLEDETLGFHPLHNAATVCITPDQLKQVIEASGHTYQIMEFAPVA